MASPSRRPFRRARRHEPPLSFSTALLSMMTLAPSISHALNITPAPPANIDFSRLGRVGVAGDFTGISLYEFEGQNESSFTNNGSESLLTQLPNSAFASLVSTDASIRTMCTFTRSNGDAAGVLLGGNFTSLNGQKSQAIARYDPDTGEITPLDGLEGQVNALFCDRDTDRVYVGGNFKKDDSTNAIAWNEDDGWVSLPFTGFNGPVSSIAKASNGHIIFGGSFTGIGNATSPTTPDDQVINISDAEISAGLSSTATGFSDPRNIICKTDGADGPGNTWLLADNSPGFWQADFDFGFRPTKLRLWNTRQDGRGTKTWRFTVIPDNGILNFTYIDPATGQNSSCTNQCPLSNDPEVPFQDFHFVNSVGMSSFRIDISEFYGTGGGLNGIQMFGDDIFSYAINRFNEPACAGLSTASSATATGPWEEVPSAQSSSMYLSARLSAPITEDSASIVFFPDIRESGNYSVNMYTPGCIGDGTCASRGQVNITGVMSSNNRISFSTSLFQTNNFDKYDQIYFGFVDATSSSFRPSVTITPLAGQNLDEMVFVAQRVGFSLINSTGGLNGLFDYDPTLTEVQTSDIQSSAINKLGSDFSGGSVVSSLATAGDVLFVGGELSSRDVQNIVSINTANDRVATLGGGLDGTVNSMLLANSTIYVGGQFSGAVRNVPGLSNVASYDTERDVWTALGAGVNGAIQDVVAMQLNLTADNPETVITFTGDFTECVAFDGNPTSRVAGLAIWVPSRNNWLQNLDQTVPGYSGALTASILDLPDGGSLYAGSLSSSQVSASGAASLTDGNLNRFPVDIASGSESESSPTISRRALLSDGEVSGVVAGAFYETDGRNVTVLAGQFSAQVSDGSIVKNLVLIDGADNDSVSGLGSAINDNSTFTAVAVGGDVMYAGGSVTGVVDGDEIHGIVAYNLATKSFADQPPAISGDNATVLSIAIQPQTGLVFVGGSFSQAGSLPCSGICVYNAEQAQWQQPGVNIQGTVHSLIWTSDTTLVAAGSLAVNETVSTSLAIYSSETQTWDTYPGAEGLPGAVDAMTMGSSDGSQLWVSGHAHDGAIFLMKYDGVRWITAPQGLLPGSLIKSMQVFSLTDRHDTTDLLPNRQSLVLTGSLALQDFGTASAVIFDGQAYRPYAFTTNSGNTVGSISKIFSQNQDFFTAGGSNMPLVFVVLIGLAISLGLMLIIVAAGIFLDRLQKKREGYVPAPTTMIDRSSGIRRIPPSQLFESLGRERADIPQV
ncbi:hypothetical protein jhhlp_002244 [Lomentospora prolificans]|uniref:Cellular morphogenesis protein n=1 Tax=Lomentospora prolificans TaxID=41688 RepID=A0A2N3NDQ9_9PEZI|nr:hypothetical protein jhhlp_002244 [Lomentospora prolificans]